MEAIRLDKIDTRAPANFDKEKTKEKLSALLQKLDGLQNLLYADCKYSVLVIIQGMDASGKDGLIRNVFGHLNPQGVKVKSFKEPTAEDLAHDFLWRVHKYAPPKGIIRVFNRSHYDEVLITRVHKTIDDATTHERMKAINDFEKLLTRHNDTQILKFYLHVSREQQLKRFEERKKDKTKRWKYDEKDLKETKLRDEYLAVYEDCFHNCNKIPWIIVPADQNWYKEYVVANAVCHALEALKMQYPGVKK